MAVDQVQPITPDTNPEATLLQPVETPPPPLSSTRSADQEHLLDLVSREGDGYVSQEDSRGLSRFLMAMLWGSIALALAVALYVLIGNGPWMSRYLPR